MAVRIAPSIISPSCSRSESAGGLARSGRHVAVALLVAALLHLADRSSLGQQGFAPQAELVDLTYPFDDQTIYWPTEDGFRLVRGPAGMTDAGYFYAANRFAAAEHGGTHIDAPYHFRRDGMTDERIPLERLVGPAVCVDLAHKCAVDRDYQVSAEDLMAWEKAQQQSLDGRIVLIRTGYGDHWPDRRRYLGTADRGRAAVARLHFPGLHHSAADWLVTRRNVPLVGIDTASIDYGQSQDYRTHVRLFQAGVPVLENVAHLDRLPPTGFSVAALPMKIANGSGAPCRIIAIVNK